MTKQIAVITGATRGIGLETARQLGAQGYRLILSGTTQTGVDNAVDQLIGEGIQASGHALDQADDASVATFAKWLADQTAAIDVLVNCAGIFPEKDHPAGRSVLTGDSQAVLDTFNVNTFGPWRLTRALATMINPNGRIVNVSSKMGSLNLMNEAGAFGYRASKTALNTLTRLTALELKDRGIMVNAVHPGWVQTDMGGAAADVTTTHSAKGLVWAATLQPGGPTGEFFWDKEPLEW